MAEFYQIARKLDNLIGGEVNDKSIETVLDIISIDTVHEDYLFRTIRDLRWFKPLKDNGYFDPKPSLQPKRTDAGGYQIPPWNVLQFLEYVSEQTSKPNNEKLAIDLQDIIKKVTNYRIDNQRLLDNFHIWQSFVNIICNLPNRTISLDVIELVETWLDTKIGLVGLDLNLTKKLIPKFLNSKDSGDQKKAEKLIIASTMIQSPSISDSDEKHSIRKNDPDTVIESYWLRKFFKKYNDRIAKTCSPEVIHSIAKKLITVLKLKRGKVWKIVEYGDKKYLIDVSLTEVNDIIFKVGIIDDKLTNNKGEGLFGKRPTSEVLLSFVVEDVSDIFHFTQVTHKKLAESSDLAELAEGWDGNFLNNLFDSLFVDYSYIWFPILYKNPSVGKSSADVTLVTILKDLILAKAKYDPNAAYEVIVFLAKMYRYPLFNRIFLYLIGNKWDDFGDFFYKMLEADGTKIFNDPHYEQELYKILEINNKKIGKKQKKLIKRIVEQGPTYIHDHLKENRNVAAWKQKWFFPLKSDPEFGKLYKACTEIIKLPQDRLLRKTTDSVRSGPGPSPLTLEKILQLPVKALVVFLEDFQTKDIWRGPTVGGLSRVLKEAVKTDIQRFSQSLEQFHEVGFIYIYEILSGFHESCKENKYFEWCKTFNFIYTYINRESFWNDEYIVEKDNWLGNADHLWIIGIIAELIEEGTRDNSHVFERQHIKKAKEILFLILNKLLPDIDVTSEYVSHALNSAAGKTITAFIYLVLRISRLDSKTDTNNSARWENEYRIKYDELLEALFIEAYTLLGRYLPNFFYLDQEWVSEKISEFESLQNTPQWEAFMDGYFSIGKLYDDLYDMMSKHYSYAILYQFKDMHTREYLVQHISLAYLRKKEAIDNTDGNLCMLLNKWNTDDIKIMVDFFWGQREMILKNEEMRNKVLSFWQWLFNTKYGKNEYFDNMENSVLARLAKFSVFLRTIDDQTFEWLLISVRHIDGFESSYIIRSLAKLNEKQSIKYVGQLLLKMVESRRIDHEKDRVLSIVKKLYKNGEKEVANGICNAFGMRGDGFLREIYDEFNPIE